jgi:NAD-dependent dihydropyrimidine dehydrogenase PreA subunit
MNQRGPIVAPPSKIRADLRILAEQCKGCEFCIEFCPTSVLARSEGYNAKGYHYPVVVADTCVDCKLCLTICPEYAIWPVPRKGSSARRLSKAAQGNGAQGNSALRAEADPARNGLGPESHGNQKLGTECRGTREPGTKCRGTQETAA